jgi:hypothetical protein
MIDIVLAKKLTTMKSEPKNKDPLAPWNNPLYKDNPLAVTMRGFDFMN